MLFENQWLITMRSIFLPTILIYFVVKSISQRLMLIDSYMVKEKGAELIISEGEDEISS